MARSFAGCAAMARAGRIVSLASYMGNPDYYIVSVLQPFELRVIR